MTAIAILPPVQTKTCTKCGQTLSTLCFDKSSKGALNVASVCKKCTSVAKKAKAEELKSIDPIAYKKAVCEKQKKWADKNKDKVKATFDAWKEKNKDYFSKLNSNMSKEEREKLNSRARKRYAANPDIGREKTKSFRESNPEKVRNSYNKWLKKTPLNMLSTSVRRLIRSSIGRLGYTKRSKSHEILGCDWEFFKSHIERQFAKGMTWENRSEFHIDHIVPIATATTEEEVIALNHFTNLRPMWAKDNLAKGAKITHLI